MNIQALVYTIVYETSKESGIAWTWARITTTHLLKNEKSQPLSKILNRSTDTNHWQEYEIIITNAFTRHQKDNESNTPQINAVYYPILVCQTASTANISVDYAYSEMLWSSSLVIIECQLKRLDPAIKKLFRSKWYIFITG